MSKKSYSILDHICCVSDREIEGHGGCEYGRAKEEDGRDEDEGEAREVLQA